MRKENAGALWEVVIKFNSLLRQDFFEIRKGVVLIQISYLFLFDFSIVSNPNFISFFKSAVAHPLGDGAYIWIKLVGTLAGGIFSFSQQLFKVYFNSAADGAYGQYRWPPLQKGFSVLTPISSWVINIQLTIMLKGMFSQIKAGPSLANSFSIPNGIITISMAKKKTAQTGILARIRKVLDALATALMLI